MYFFFFFAHGSFFFVFLEKMKRTRENSGLDFLFNNTCKYNFDLPRTRNLLQTATSIPSTTKPCYVTRDFILQGPYDDLKDSKTLQKLQVTLDKLLLLHYTKKMHLIPESIETPNQIWFLCEYNGHLPHPYTNKHNWNPDVRLVCQIVIAILLKKVLQIGGGWENILGSSGKIYLHCLDDINVWDFHTCCLEFSKEFNKSVIKYMDSVAEYINLMTSRIEHVWNDVDVLLWKLEVAKWNIPMDFKNVEKFGWPVQENQRVMIRYSENVYVPNNDKKLIPGTILYSENNKLHVPLDYTSMGFIFRNVCIDKSFRYLLGTSSHVDQKLIIATDVRKMTTIEESKYHKPIVSHVSRHLGKNEFYIGDLVLLYDQDIHEEINHNYKVYEEKLHQSIGVGIVIGNIQKNQFWKTIYNWKTKQVHSQRTSQMYWIKDNQGMVVFYQDAEKNLDHITPFSMMNSLFSNFQLLL